MAAFIEITSVEVAFDDSPLQPKKALLGVDHIIAVVEYENPGANIKSTIWTLNSGRFFSELSVDEVKALIYGAL